MFIVSAGSLKLGRAGKLVNSVSVIHEGFSQLLYPSKHLSGTEGTKLGTTHQVCWLFLHTGFHQRHKMAPPYQALHPEEAGEMVLPGSLLMGEETFP